MPESSSDPHIAFTRHLVLAQPALYGFLISLVHDTHAADDLLQDLATRLWTKFGEYDERRPDLALRVLHGMADAADPENLSRLLSASAENRQRFLQHAALHGMLAQEARAGAFADNSDAFFREIEKPHAKPARILRFWIPAAAAAALVIGWLMVIPLLTTISLLSTDPLPADFFSHTFHHEPGRPAITE